MLLSAMAWITKNSAGMKVEKRAEPYFTAAMRERFTKEILPRYETKLAALLPCLHEVQHAHGWIPGQAMVEIAEFLGVTPADVIDAHASREYLVYCIGFAPGFTYCGTLPDELVVPRLASPRVRVPTGSVAIAGRQTGIYALASPGGWNLIGRTDLRLFEAGATPPVRFKPGDRIRFVPNR